MISYSMRSSPAILNDGGSRKVGVAEFGAFGVAECRWTRMIGESAYHVRRNGDRLDGGPDRVHGVLCRVL
jgi:hypothetical protein